MQKFNDYTALGGFPMDVDVLGYDRQGLYETVLAFVKDGGSTPMILSGNMGTSAWLVFNNEMLPYTAPSTIPPLLPGQDYYIIVNDVRDNAVFEDGTTHPVLNVARSCSLQVADTSSPPAGGVLVSSFVPWQKYLGINARTSWVNVWSATTGAFTGSISVRKNLMNNTLQIKGTITVMNTVPTPSIYYTLATLDAAYRPSTTVPFSLYYRYHNTTSKESTTIDYLRTLNGELESGGNITVGFIKPETGVASYDVTFNTIIPLD